MKLDPNSPLWVYPGGAMSDLLFKNRLETFLFEYEDHLVDEYIECRLHIDIFNPESDTIETAERWVGSAMQIRKEVKYLHETYGITLDKVFEVFDSFPKYDDMSDKCKDVYNTLMGVN
jgi:hypothetical protein